jgi:molybdate transport system substrate-binding protein
MLLLAVVLSFGSPAMAGGRLTVFAAASLTEALTEIGQAYGERSGVEVRFSFAASSTLARQIEAGAPADVVALASQEWADYLTERNLVRPETRTSPARNRLVIIVPSASSAALSDPPNTAEIAAVLGPQDRIAIGDPAHVPAGMYAREALENLGLWPSIASRLAPSDNVRAALALVARGETPLGVVYATDAAISTGVRVVATLPTDSHAPISYPFAITSHGDRTAAEQFLTFTTGAEGRAIFARFGFTSGEN